MRIAIIGAGRQGLRHAHDWEVAGHEVAAIYDPDSGAARRLAHCYQAMAATSELQAIMAADVVSIASPDREHGHQACTALGAARRAVFCEKPLCRTRLEYEHIKKMWQGAGYPGLAVNFPLRLRPVFQQLRGRIRAGGLGTLYAADLHYLWGRLHKLGESWRAEDSDYRVFSGGASHLVDLLAWLTGQYPFSVRASGNNLCAGKEYPDFVSATYEYHSGMIATVTANFGAPPLHRHVVNLYGSGGEFHYGGGGEEEEKEEGRTLIAEFAGRLRGGDGGALDAEAEHLLEVVRCCVEVEEFPRLHFRCSR